MLRHRGEQVAILSAAAVLLLCVACGGGGSETCSADDDEPSECSDSGMVQRGAEEQFRRWGAWARDYNGDGVVDRVNGWNDCGSGGTSPGTPGTLDCPPGTTGAVANSASIICTVPGQSQPLVYSCDT